MVLIGKSSRKKISKAITFACASATLLNACSSKEWNENAQVFNDAYNTLSDAYLGIIEEPKSDAMVPLVSMFKDSTTVYAGMNGTDIYSDFGETKTGHYLTNDEIDVVGQTDDNKWYKTSDGQYVKSEDTMKEPITHVIESPAAIVYAQYQNVNLHSEPDKSSAVISYLSVTEDVTKLGEVEFAYGTTTSSLDSTKDHGWSKVSVVRGDKVVTGYVYTDYIGTEKVDKASASKAVEAPIYTSEEKAGIKADAKKYLGIDVPANATDEQLMTIKEQTVVKAEEIARAEREEAAKEAQTEYLNSLIADIFGEILAEAQKDKEAKQKAEKEKEQASSGGYVFINPDTGKPYTQEEKDAELSGKTGITQAEIDAKNEAVYGEKARALGMTVAEYIATSSARHGVTWY